MILWYDQKILLHKHLKKNEVQLIHILTLEKSQDKNNPKQLVSFLFLQSFHYIPTHPNKPKLFYEFILVDIDFVEVSHNKDSNGNIQFWKIKIYAKIGTIHGIPQDLSQEPLAFIYYDWSYIFLSKHKKSFMVYLV